MSRIFISRIFSVPKK